MQEIGHDDREQRRVVHDERRHERDQQQEADLVVTTREPHPEGELASGDGSWVAWRRVSARTKAHATTTARKLAALR